nr:hypothetical protein BaRGS_030589 [Batillaria attramentaria]
MLPIGLTESISKVRSSVAYAVSAIAHWDWPEQWPNLFPLLMQALTSGEVLGFENLVYSVFEFVHALIDTSRFRNTVKGTIDQILYYVIVYMQMTEDQSVTRHLQESDAAKNAGSEHWWKIHESCMLAMGSVQQMVVEAIQQGKVQFYLTGFLQSVVLDDMNLSGFCKPQLVAYIRPSQPVLDLMLRSVLSKMQQTETLSVMQSLLMVFAHLLNIQLEPVLEFLTSVPGPTGKPALEFVLTECALALAKLLRHAIMTNDPRLQNITVQGEPITDASTAPDQWTTVPVLVKIYKLLINELSNQLEAALAKNEEDENDDDENGFEDEDEDGEDLELEDESVAGQTLSSLLEEFAGNYQAMGLEEEDDDDPDTLNDPISQVDLQAYLTEFLQTLSTQACYSMFSAHHNPAEVQVLRTININV